MRTSRLYLFVLLNLLIIPRVLFANNDIKIIKERVRTELMKPQVDDIKIKTLVDNIESYGTWPGINYEDVSRTGFEHRNHTVNMVLLARAYEKKGSKYYRSKKVKKTIELALKNWVDNDYICDNWWHNQIGVPYQLVTLMMIMGDKLPDELVKKTQPIIGRAHINAPGARPGGDRIKIAGIQAKNMLFLNDSKTFNEVIRVIETEIKFVEWVGAKYGYSFRNIPTGFSNRSAGGRGIQFDNSFHHRVDGVNNTLSYGLGYASAFVEWAVYTTGTPYAFSNEKLEQLVDYYLDGICKTAVFGKYPDAGAKNRSISREGTLSPYNAVTAEKLLITTDYRKSEIQEIVDIRNNGIKPTISHATFFWHSEHFTFQRPDFFTSVRLYSTRTHNMEQPYNSEGLLNHHRGDGTNHISRTGDEYFDIAPVFDYQKIPGATILQKSQLPSEKEIQKLGITDFAGAVTDGKYGVVGFDFKSPHDPLIARKSWFFFDDEYVCLGSGISSRKNLSVVTTLNQCLLRDDVTISIENKTSVIPTGEKEFENIDWVFQDGIGYIFPEPSKINIKNNAASGSWYKINKQSRSSKEEIKLDVFKLWLDHGDRPSDESYAYIISPATTIEKLEEEISNNNIDIISNTTDIQAVKHSNLQMYQVVFYKSGQIKLSDELMLVSESPGIFMLKMKDGKISKISVSDPNRELSKMHFSLTIPVKGLGENYDTHWIEKKSLTEVSIELPHGVYAGKSVTVNFIN